MKTLSRLLVLLLAMSATAVMAQVPPISGAPTDRPMPPEPGERTETDRTLDPGETDLPQADTGDQLRLLDQSLQDFERDATSMDATERDRKLNDFQQRRGDLQTMVEGPDMSPDDRRTFMNDYAALDRDLMQARLQLANDNAYHRMVGDRMSMYGTNLQRLNERFSEATGNDRAEYARQLIQLRKQQDDLARRHMRLQHGRNLTDADRTQLRNSLTTDLATYDRAVYDVSMDMGAPMYMSGNMPGPNR